MFTFMKKREEEAAKKTNKSKSKKFELFSSPLWLLRKASAFCANKLAGVENDFKVGHNEERREFMAKEPGNIT